MRILYGRNNLTCKIFGHKWIPVYIKGKHRDTSIKIIGAHCNRCYYGYNEIVDTENKLTELEYATYNKEYFNR